jgi:hypothetical protein
MDRCTCSACNKRFNSMYAFDKHRRDHSCLSDEQMLAIGMAQSKTGLWVTAKWREFRETVPTISGYQSNFDHWPKV